MTATRGSGSLGALEFQPPMDLDSGNKQLDRVQDAQAHVQSLGVQLPGLPAGNYRGEMPADLTSLDDADLGDLLNKLSSYCGFLEAQLAVAQSKLDVAKSQYEFVYARVRIGVKAAAEGRVTDRDKTDLVVTDPRVKLSEGNVIYAETCQRLLRVMLNNAQRNWDTVSRRITQRGQEIERMKRESNVAGVPAVSRSFNRPGMAPTTPGR